MAAPVRIISHNLTIIVEFIINQLIVGLWLFLFKNIKGEIVMLLELNKKELQLIMDALSAERSRTWEYNQIGSPALKRCLEDQTKAGKRLIDKIHKEANASLIFIQ